MATMTVAVDLELPDDVLADLGAPTEVTAWARQVLVLQLLREARISQGCAARLLGITRRDLLDLMARDRILSGPQTADEVDRELNALRAARQDQPLHRDQMAVK